MTTIQLVDTNVILMEKDIIERYEVGYILRNGANLTIIKQFKGKGTERSFTLIKKV